MLRMTVHAMTITRTRASLWAGYTVLNPALNKRKVYTITLDERGLELVTCERSHAEASTRAQSERMKLCGGDTATTWDTEAGQFEPNCLMLTWTCPTLG